MKNRNQLSFSEKLGITQIIFTLIVGLCGYVFIERIRLQFEELKNTREKVELYYLRTKIISELRPKVTIEVIDDKKSNTLLSKSSFELLVKNNGQHHIFLKKGVFSGAKKYEVIDKEKPTLFNAGDFSFIVKESGQGIAPAGEEKIKVEYISKDNNIKIVGISGSFNVDVITDPLIIKAIQEVLPEGFDDKIIKDLSTHHIVEPIVYGEVSIFD